MLDIYHDHGTWHIRGWVPGSKVIFTYAYNAWNFTAETTVTRTDSRVITDEWQAIEFYDYLRANHATGRNWNLVDAELVTPAAKCGSPHCGGHPATSAEERMAYAQRMADEADGVDTEGRYEELLTEMGI